jgi:uncharacterized protein (TIGR04255 family)
MSINEIFPNSTVKQVIFQIRFPNLFYIESKIGELQLGIMQEFPESSLIERRKIVFVDVGTDLKPLEDDLDTDKETGRKIWQFRSPKDFQLNVLSNSLDITSQHHKTYDFGDGDKFRDIIKFVLDTFLKVTAIPIINRIGLRYVDECPVPLKNNDSYISYYDSAFPLNRFNLADAEEMVSIVKTKRGKHYLRYIESLQKVDNEYKLVLDFDGYAINIRPEIYLDVTDELHTIISDEFEKTIKEPVLEYMRKPKE